MVQNFVIPVLLAWDLLFLYNLHDYHNVHGDEPGHTEVYRALYFVDEMRFKIPTETIMLVVHIATATLPLLLSLVQVWRFIRSKSLDVHRWTGRVCLLSTFIGLYPCMRLCFTGLDDNPFILKLVVFVLAVLWGVSAVLSWYYAYNKDIPRHKDWSLRFATYTHVIPLVTRVLSWPVWIFFGRPAFTINPPSSGNDLMFPTFTTITAILLFPLSEGIVWYSKQK